MMMFAKLLTGDMYVVEIDPTDTIQRVKEKIAEKCGKGAEDMRVICCGIDLIPFNTVMYYSMGEGSVIHCVFRLRAGLQITVKTLTGKTSAIQVTEDSNIQEIKQRIQHREKVPIESQTLVCNGQQLQNSKKLNEYDIQGAVYLIIKLRGG